MSTIIESIKRQLKRNKYIYKISKNVFVGFRNLFSKHGYIKQYVFFPIEAVGRYFHIWPFYNKDVKRLEEYRDKYKNERCFIIATGPSLCIEDVEKLQNEITIGVNSIYRLYDKTDFRPTFYVALDEEVQKKTDDCISNTDKLCKQCSFANLLHKVNWDNVCHIPVCYQNHWFMFGNDRYNYAKNLKYCTNLLWGIYDKYTVTNAAIDIAIYMGCKDIYLIGVDCDWTGSKIHFDDSEEQTPVTKDFSYHSQISTITGYRFMEMETKKRGIHIYNATRGGKLEEFDRVSLDSLV